VVQIGLKKASNGKDDYSVATFRRIGDFDGEQLANIKSYADGFRGQIKMLLQQRMLDDTNHSEELPTSVDGSTAYQRTDEELNYGVTGN